MAGLRGGGAPTDSGSQHSVDSFLGMWKCGECEASVVIHTYLGECT
jgi:hypothetical protein